VFTVNEWSRKTYFFVEHNQQQPHQHPAKSLTQGLSAEDLQEDLKKPAECNYIAS